jgi:carbonic anhydrase/acetyltransferase-like protein (isoleucine patch superfamily)
LLKQKTMALIKSCRGIEPQFGDDVYLAENATVVGDVISIRMGNQVNVQDGAVIHCTYEKTKTILGNNVSIGHNALVHGCTVEDNVLIGMGSIVMDNCYIESNCIIAAGAVLLEGTRVESWSVYAGIPAKKVKTLSPELFDGEVLRIANNYVMYSGWFK